LLSLLDTVSIKTELAGSDLVFVLKLLVAKCDETKSKNKTKESDAFFSKSFA
jgi:hypothetical protein